MLDRIIAYLLWHRVKPLLRTGESDLAWSMLVAEVKRTHHVIVDAVTYQQTSSQVLADRLTRRYDLGLAMNEAAQAAMKRRGDAGGDDLLPSQKAALVFQRKDLERRINAQSPNDPEAQRELVNAQREADRALRGDV